MRSLIAVLLVGCSDVTPQEHLDSLSDRVTVMCGHRMTTPCDESPAPVGCMQQALDRGEVAVMSQSDITTHGFHNTETIITDGHRAWTFFDRSDEQGGFQLDEYGPCTGPFSSSRRGGCPAVGVDGCP